MSLTLTTGLVRPTAEVLEFDCGVRAYPPARPDGYWRLRWLEEGHRRDTTARSRDEALAKAAELVAGLARVLGAAPTPSVASHLRWCLTAMVAAGLEVSGHTAPCSVGATSIPGPGAWLARSDAVLVEFET